MNSIEDIKNLQKRIKNEGFDTPEEFCERYGSRAPDLKTMRKFWADSKTSSGGFKQKTLDTIDNCLRVPPWQYETYHTLRTRMDITEQDETKADELGGSYLYYRPNRSGVIVNGGLHLFNNHGVRRFYHFRKSENLLKYRKNRLYPSEASARPTHHGYYFVKDGRINFLGIDTTYMRPVVAANVGDKAVAYIRGIVLSRDDVEGLFAAKTFMIHEANERFEHAFSDDDVCRILNIKVPIEGILSIP